MNDKILFLAIVFAIILISPAFADSTTSTTANTLFVCSAIAPACDYDNVQSAISNANATTQYVNVSTGFTTGGFNVSKTLQIQSNTSKWATISIGSGQALTISANGVNITGFQITDNGGGVSCGSRTSVAFCLNTINNTNISNVNLTTGGKSFVSVKANNTYIESTLFTATAGVERTYFDSVSDNLTIRNSTFVNAGFGHIIVTGSGTVNISNISIVGGQLELVSTNNTYVDKSNITGGTGIAGCGGGAGFSAICSYGSGSQNLTFQNNTISGISYGYYFYSTNPTSGVKIVKETFYNIDTYAIFSSASNINISGTHIKNSGGGVFFDTGNKGNISNSTFDTIANGTGVRVASATNIAIDKNHFFNSSLSSSLPIFLQSSAVIVQGNNISNGITASGLKTFYGINITGSTNHSIFNNDINSSILAASAPNCLLCQWNTSKIATTNIIGGSWVSGNSWINFNGTDTDGDGLADTLTPYTVSGNLASGTGDYAPLVAAGFRKPNITNAFMTPNQSLFMNNLSFSFNVSAGAGSNILNSCNLTVYFPNNSNKAVGNATSQCDGANSSWRLISYSVPVRADWNGTARAEINVSDNGSASSTTSLNLTFDTLLDISFGINDHTATGAQGVNTSFSFPVNISTNESVQFGCGNVFGGEQTNDSTSSNISNIFLYGCQINETKLGNMTGNPPTGLLGSSNVNIPLNRTFTVWFVPQSNTTNFTKYEWNATFNLTQSQQYWRNVTITYTVAPQVNAVAVSFANGSNNWAFGTINSGTQVCNVFSLNATGNETASFINLTSAATGIDTLNGFVANESNFNITNGSSKNVHFCFTPTVSANTNFDSGDLNYVYASWIGGSSNAPSSSSSVVATNGTINGYSVTTPLITGTVNAVATTTTTATSGGGGGKEKKECSLVFSPPKDSGLRFTRLDKSLALSITNNEDENFVPSVKIIKPDVSFANDASPYLKIEQIPPNILSGGTEKIFVTASPPDFNVTYEAIMSIGSSKCADVNIPITLNVPFDSSFVGLGEKLGIGALVKFLNKSIEDTAIKIWEVLLVIFFIAFGSILFFTKKIIPAAIITLFIIIGIGFLFKILGVVGNG